MVDAKMVADLITATRGLLGLAIIWLGIIQGSQALPMVVFLMLLDWTGDFADGGIAHRSRHPRRTRIGDSDIYIDLFVSVCLGIYLLQSGFVELTLGFLYLLGWGVILWRFGLDKNLLMLVQAPIYFYFILTALRVLPDIGSWLVIWVLVATAINWRRFTREIIPRFIAGMRSLHGDGKTHNP
jgi:hypothetical protein